MRLDNEETYDLECVEIRERSARSDQFRYCQLCTFTRRVKQNPRLREPGAT